MILFGAHEDTLAGCLTIQGGFTRYNPGDYRK